jgi:hypothetical protein
MMATLTFTPLEEPERWSACSARDCGNPAVVLMEQTHTDDGESWILCVQHAISGAAKEMAWVAMDGEGDQGKHPSDTWQSPNRCTHEWVTDGLFHRCSRWVNHERDSVLIPSPHLCVPDCGEQD